MHQDRRKEGRREGGRDDGFNLWGLWESGCPTETPVLLPRASSRLTPASNHLIYADSQHPCRQDKGRWCELYSPHISRSLEVLSLRGALRSTFPSYKSPRPHLCPPKNINSKSPVTSPFGLFPDQYLSEALQHQISKYTSGFTFPLWFWLPGNSLFSAWVLHLTDWFQIGKGVRQGCILSPCLFNLNAEYIMRNAGLEEAQAGIKIAGRNISNLRYADDTTLMAESEEALF